MSFFIWVNGFFSWLAKFTQDSSTGYPSMKRAALIVGVASLSASDLILALAAFYGRSVGVEITAVSGTLGTVIGYAYVQGKKVEGETNNAAT